MTIENETMTHTRTRAVPFGSVALAYLALIMLGEILTTFSDPRIGMAMHCLIFLGMLVHAYFVRDREKELAFIVSLLFAPMIRILSLALPLTGFPSLYWYLIISIPLFLGMYSASQALNLSWRKMGLSLNEWMWQLPIALTGLLFGVVEYIILRPASLIDQLTWQTFWWPALVLTICTGLLEEMIFRGLLQETGRDVLKKWNLVYISLLFAVLHLGYKSMIDILFVFIVGGFFAWAVKRTGSLVGVTIAHGLTNTMLFLVMPHINSVLAF